MGEPPHLLPRAMQNSSQTAQILRPQPQILLEHLQLHPLRAGSGAVTLLGAHTPRLSRRPATSRIACTRGWKSDSNEKTTHSPSQASKMRQVQMSQLTRKLEAGGETLRLWVGAVLGEGGGTHPVLL